MNSLGFIIFSLLYLHVGSSDIHKEGLGVWNGYEVKPHSIPFQAYLVSFTEGFAMYCGGSLISQNYILTVAHCILGADNVMVYLGVHNTSDFDENVQIFNATELYPHEKYKVSAQKVVNNIGVIKLPSSAQLTTVVQTGKLISESDYQFNPDQIGINATRNYYTWTLIQITLFGSSNIHKEGLGIWNGYEVKPHSIPFQAYLVSFYDGFPEYCGGSLISENYILTVAHCIKDADFILVYLGVHNRSNIDENVQIFNATEIYPHEEFKISGQKVLNDIGVIKLPSSAQLTTVVQPGKLISESDYLSNPDQIGINATVSGWGKTGNPGNYSEVLLAGLLHVVDPTYCESDPTYQNDQYLCIDLNNFENRSESGSGDSGGPLFKVTDDQQVIVGLVSMGSEGSEADTNVGYYRKWIAEHTDVVF